MTALRGLITPEALQDLLGNQPDLCCLDIRLPADGGRAAYESGHIPAAIFSDYAGDGWRRREGQVPGLLPTPEHLSALFGRLGLTRNRPVVLVPLGGTANDFAAAARAYWTLKLAGHDQLAILDGGTKGWMASGRKLETGWNEPKPAAPYPLHWQSGLRAQPEAVMAARAANHPLVDARSQSYFEGHEKAPESLAAGHIPGAISRDYAGLFDPKSHRLLPQEQLADAFADLPPGPVITYCNTGHTAALDWFVLSEILGRQTALYDGSMTEWTQDTTRPVATVQT